MTRAHWQALREAIRRRRQFWHTKDIENAESGVSSVEPLRALYELQWVGEEMTRIRDRRKRRHGKAHVGRAA